MPTVNAYTHTIGYLFLSRHGITFALPSQVLLLFLLKLLVDLCTLRWLVAMCFRRQSGVFLRKTGFFAEGFRLVLALLLASELVGDGAFILCIDG